MNIASIVRTFAMFCTAAVFAVAAHAQQFPSRPIKILVGFGAGGGADAIARIYAAKLQEMLNVPVVVENKPGANQLLASQPVMAAAPDGYLLWMGTGSALSQSPGVRTDLPYDPLKNFTLISRIGEGDAVLSVRSGLPVNSLRDLISHAKANPGKLNYASAGFGTANHLLVEYIKMLTDIEVTHIAYKSDADVVREIAAGTVDFGIPVSMNAVPFALDGKFKPIAVTGTERLKALPNVASVGEGDVPALKSLGVYSFYGMAGPAGLPPEVIKILNDALNKIARMPDVAQRLETFHIRPANGSPTEFRSYVESELKRWREVGKTLKLGKS